MSARRVLVTGSSRGIGLVTAMKLAADGFDITLHCKINVGLAQNAAAEISALGRTAHVLQFDVRDRSSAKQSLERDQEEHGAYYGVVLNAGIARDNAFPALSEEDWDDVIGTSLDGFYNVLHPLIMPMVRARTGGRIVTLASVSGVVGNRRQVNYSAAKGGVIGATKALAVELATRKITVNCVAPGFIKTDMTGDTIPAEALKMIPLGRIGIPEEVAAAVSFLFSDGAAYITRQVIGVNGGLT